MTALAASVRSVVGGGGRGRVVGGDGRVKKVASLGGALGPAAASSSLSLTAGRWVARPRAGVAPQRALLPGGGALAARDGLGVCLRRQGAAAAAASAGLTVAVAARAFGIRGATAGRVQQQRCGRGSKTAPAAAVAAAAAAAASEDEPSSLTGGSAAAPGGAVEEVPAGAGGVPMDGYAFFGALLLNMLLGTLYCWSVYLVPLEQALGVGRGTLSGVFSLATICFTAALSVIGPYFYSRFSPAKLGAGTAVLGGAGMLVAALALPYVSVIPLFVGYALLFGVASGIGYGLSVQLSDRAPLADGLSMGLITSARAGGAFVFAPLIKYLLDVGGVGHAMSTMGGLLLASAVPIWLLLARRGFTEPLANKRRDGTEELTPEEEERDRQLRPAMLVLWGSMGLGVFAGLMVMAHAATLLYSHGATIGTATAGVSIVSLFTTGGRILGGWACDRDRWGGAQRVLRVAPVLSIAPLMWGALSETSVVAAQLALAAAALSYGVLASAVPVEVRRRTGPRDFARAYGKVYTAWGLAGLAAPWL
eukprot:CAMPEP_0197589844 /NCGR_PEP_ID=MMETSP1326-20131121/10644_1 /TAXON_ID=1155430 /ORGANISM="Genus nov. species nov., Strain RCC2288" /LENGTH=534 /DNA_ID=CAMNT_0043154825 /DNA_START=30 /DNA_END=1631 /DNA_ORIENTATION=+